MEFRAHLKNVHMSPRKMRLVRSVIRGRSAAEAVQQLTFMPGKASGIVLKVLKSAMANAQHNFDADKEALMVGDLVIDEGIVMKRWRPVSKGMAHPILKRMSHVTVILKERGEARAVVAKKTEISDITADEHIRNNEPEVEETPAPEVVEEHQHDRQKPILDKQQQAFMKQKMNQGGGSRAKSHRRKSVSEG
jgi:large subunit ribosomal protein L22